MLRRTLQMLRKTRCELVETFYGYFGILYCEKMKKLVKASHRKIAYTNCINLQLKL